MATTEPTFYEWAFSFLATLWPLALPEAPKGPLLSAFANSNCPRMSRTRAAVPVPA
jgi:hypothetical protein